MAERSLFRGETFDLLAGEFATNLPYYRNYTADDEIAGMFLGCALDILDCTYYTFAKSLPGEKRRIMESFADGWHGDVFGTGLFETILDPGLAGEVIAQHNLLLEALQDKYRWLVRGPRPICWEESAGSISEQSDACRARSRCCDEQSDKSLARMCSHYYTAWRGTMLAMNGREKLRGDNEALSREIRTRCRVLNLLTRPEGLAAYLELHYGEESPPGEMRTVRGVIPRLLTILIDEALGDLNRMMNLPPGEGLHFTPASG